MSSTKSPSRPTPTTEAVATNAGADDTKLTLQQGVYQSLRQKIIRGEIEPGRSLTIRGLAEEMGVSMTPVREALRRLISERALENLPNRRVKVSKMTIERFEDLTQARVALETLAARRALPNVTDSLVDHMEQLDFALDRAIAEDDKRGYHNKNFDFHFSLYHAANSDVLIPMIESLWLQFGPYLHLTREGMGTVYVEDHHKHAIVALRNRHEEDLVHALTRDIIDGMRSLSPSKLLSS